jgi:hypothetical protein
MWVYLCALQLLVVIVKEAALDLPLSTSRFIESIYYSISLRPLKDMFTDRQNSFAEWLQGSVLFSGMGGVLVSLVLLVVFTILVLLQGRFSKTKNVIQQIRGYLLYNFVIRYFQTTYLFFGYFSFLAAYSGKRTFERVLASTIIILQFAAVAFLGLVYTQIPSQKLNLWAATIGNLYKDFDTDSVIKICFGLLFYVQRSLISVILAYGTSFCVQIALLQVIVLLNFVCLLHISPYKDPKDSWQEILNCALVLMTLVLLLPLSTWTVGF